MKTKYYLYAARVAGCKLELEAIFNSEAAAAAYAKSEKEKMTCCAGMDFFYNIKAVLVEE